MPDNPKEQPGYHTNSWHKRHPEVPRSIPILPIPENLDGRKYSPGDKLAIALASGSVVVLIFLFIAEKTPLTVVILLLLALGFAFYPIIHFVKSNALRGLAL